MRSVVCSINIKVSKTEHRVSLLRGQGTSIARHFFVPVAKKGDCEAHICCERPVAQSSKNPSELTVYTRQADKRSISVDHSLNSQTTARQHADDGCWHSPERAQRQVTETDSLP
ncbi:hypothetical protein RRG08_009293 [Elysia crispata]|uniref:Uncharacterized protein n=1 Tax=Elysia crispata TaxID=231223 RepID=A0AAE1DL64_9GAST|nr:hypothetical protein RRG08_009293 [Elysia crispata]